MTVVSGAIEQIADGIIAHRLVPMAVTGKDQISTAGQREKSSQDLDTLRSQRHEMIAADLCLSLVTAFHSNGRDAPERRLAVQIFKFVPLRSANLIRSNGCQRQQPQGQPRGRPREIAFRIVDHLAQRREVGDRRLTALEQGLEHGAQLLGRILVDETGGDRMDEHCRDTLANALCGLDCASTLDGLEHLKDLRRRQLGNRQVPDRREYVAFEAAQHVAGVDAGPLPLGIIVPDTRDTLECLSPSLQVGIHANLPGDQGIKTFLEQGLGLVPLLAGLQKGHSGIIPQTDHALLAGMGVGPSP